MPKIRVLVVDDHSVVRSGLRWLINSEPDLQVVGEATDGLEAVQKAQELQPDIVLMDITMPGLTGLEATRRIKKTNPDVAVLTLTMHESEEHFFQALQAGALGYIPKSAPDTEVLAAIRSAARGQSYLSPAMATLLVSDYIDRARTGEVLDPYERLTDREREILHLIASGFTTREIADRLTLSVNTVHNHRASLMEKLGLHSKVELMKYAVRKGLISLES
ncbi:MAG: response regulator transcription factor [Chloroflexi bacterium]|nr:response regulator transcription factor [Chloroflexota bacterium]